MAYKELSDKEKRELQSALEEQFPSSENGVTFGKNYTGYTSDNILSSKEKKQVQSALEKAKLKLNFSLENFLDPYVNFNRFYNIYEGQELSSLHPYVFFTRPCCNILRSDKTNALSTDIVKDGKRIESQEKVSKFFREHYDGSKTLIRLLCGDTVHIGHDFLSFLTPRVETFQIPDFVLKQLSALQPLTNYAISYAGNGNESVTNGQVDITFRDDSELRLSRFFYFWTYYIDQVMKGTISPTQFYTYHKIFDYMASIYYIVCAPDMSILYFSKFVGVYPLNAPFSNQSFNLRGQTESRINVSFAYSLIEHLDPDIIDDFNVNSQKSDTNKADPYYDTGSMSMQGMVGSPFIKKQNSRYRLFWNHRQDIPDSISL